MQQERGHFDATHCGYQPITQEQVDPRLLPLEQIDRLASTARQERMMSHRLQHVSDHAQDGAVIIEDEEGRAATGWGSHGWGSAPSGSATAEPPASDR
jgi:hypothetical protein